MQKQQLINSPDISVNVSGIINDRQSDHDF